MDWISSLMSSVILTRAQESAILVHLSTMEGLSVAGGVTDRLGRAGIAFLATDRAPGRVEDVIIVSPGTGEIIAMETLYIGDDRPEIDPPSVISYKAWER